MPGLGNPNHDSAGRFSSGSGGAREVSGTSPMIPTSQLHSPGRMSASGTPHTDSSFNTAARAARSELRNVGQGRGTSADAYALSNAANRMSEFKERDGNQNFKTAEAHEAARDMHQAAARETSGSDKRDHQATAADHEAKMEQHLLAGRTYGALTQGDRVKGYGDKVPKSTMGSPMGTVHENHSRGGEDSDLVTVKWDNGTSSTHEAHELKRI